MNKNPLKITDVTLRDGHQSLLATRMRTEDILPIAAEMDKAGFYSLEVWGGATFDVPTRYLNEDPWERLAAIKWLAPKTPLQMLLRGQNLVGYRNYADDVVIAFVKHAATTGIDIFRVFDALNDERNFEVPLQAIKESGKHAQLSLCYSLTEPQMGGPVYNLEYYIKKALKMEQMGADSLCIKDMAGLIRPDDAYTLISALKKEIKIPVHLHTHYTSGMASMSMLKAIEAGVDIIDTALAPFALRTSHPAIEPFVAALQGTDRDTSLDMQHLLKLGEHFESIAPKYRDFMATNKMAVIDTEVLVHQVPGGMISNLVSQLKEANALDRIGEVYAEIPKVRKELGYPPLVTPTSQIVGIQAVQNVLFGRYKVISAQVKDLVYGLYGQTPVPIPPEIQKLVLKGYERGETPITARPGDILEPEMEKAYADTAHIARNLGDVLTYALYPTTGMRFLRWKYGLEAPPPETKAKKMADIKKEDELIAKAKAGKLVDPASIVIPPAPPVAIPAPVAATPAAAAPAAAAPQSAPVAAVPAPTPAAVTATPVNGTAIVAPMPGLVIRYMVKVGDDVKEGDIVAVIEAMKMAIDLPSTTKGKVKEIKFKAGDHVLRDDILAVIG
ncbi:MAG: pyruvate carboxylase subunit B [Dehalococcoidales bacterium]|nr:pyruvate carboxylase subunit B [Dehalococcoidales bacterium]